MTFEDWFAKEKYDVQPSTKYLMKIGWEAAQTKDSTATEKLGAELGTHNNARVIICSRNLCAYCTKYDNGAFKGGGLSDCDDCQTASRRFELFDGRKLTPVA